MTNTNPRSPQIISVGTALPDRVITNEHFANYLETSDEWISERTGIKERRFGSTTGQLAAEAARDAIERARLKPTDISFTILATSTPDRVMPPTSATVADLLGLKGGICDINVACTGFVTGLEMAHGLVLAGHDHVLVIGADVMSSITDQDDRGTAVLFGDGAGACIVSNSQSSGDGLLGSHFDTNPDSAEILRCSHNGKIEMLGREVYKIAVRACVDSIDKVLKSAGLNGEDINLLVAHQANVRIIEAIANRLGIGMERCALVLDKTGNTSSATIPLALAHARDNGQLKSNDNVLFCGFGAGMAWGTQIWKWG